MSLSSEFYTIIPHVFGIHRPPSLSTMQMVKQKLEMMDTLAEMGLVTKILDEEKSKLIGEGGGRTTTSNLRKENEFIKNPVDEHYEALKCYISPIESTSKDYEMIQTYVKNTHAPTHTDYHLEIEDVFVLKKHGEEKKKLESKCSELNNRKLLWHGSRITNFAGILKQGLRIAPPEAPVTGYMFGKGVYFAGKKKKNIYFYKILFLFLLYLLYVFLGDGKFFSKIN